MATQLYVEMLQAGYTQVAEFHYLHHDSAGAPYADPAEMAKRICAAADTAGIATSSQTPDWMPEAVFNIAPSTSEGSRRRRMPTCGYGRWP